MILSAPADMSTDTVLPLPITILEPAGITRSLTSLQVADTRPQIGYQ